MGQSLFRARRRVQSIYCLGFYAPLQHAVDITGRKGPVNEGRGCSIEAVIVGLGVVRPVALGDPGLNRHTGARGDTARAAGESDLEIMIGGAIGRTHRDNSTGNIAGADG